MSRSSPSSVDEAGAVRVVLVTAPEGAAVELARALVGERLAACVNLVPGIRSIYRWKGAVEEDDEVLLVAKTRSDCVDALAERVRELHPYEMPETLALPVVGGSADYLDWLRAETR